MLTARVQIGKGRKAKVRLVGVGSARFTLLVDLRASIKVKLSAKAKALLRSAHKLKVLAVVTTHNADGATASTRRTLTLVAPEKPKRRTRR